MKVETVVFLHGFASSNQGEKAKFLRDKFAELNSPSFFAINFNPTALDFEHMTITGMVDRLRQFLLDRELGEIGLIGSSMGALIALHYAQRYGCNRLLLAAPLLYYQSLGMSDQVLSWWEKRGTVDIDHYAFAGQLPLRYEFHLDGQRYEEIIDPPGEVLLIHGWKDDQVPIEDSRFYAEKYPDRVTLQEVNSDHRLSDQLDFLWTSVESFLLS